MKKKDQPTRLIHELQILQKMFPEDDVEGIFKYVRQYKTAIKRNPTLIDPVGIDLIVELLMRLDPKLRKLALSTYEYMLKTAPQLVNHDVRERVDLYLRCDVCNALSRSDFQIVRGYYRRNNLLRKYLAESVSSENREIFFHHEGRYKVCPKCFEENNEICSFCGRKFFHQEIPPTYKGDLGVAMSGPICPSCGGASHGNTYFKQESSRESAGSTYRGGWVGDHIELSCLK